jgi:hypothetical protein
MFACFSPAIWMKKVRTKTVMKLFFVNCPLLIFQAYVARIGREKLRYNHLENSRLFHPIIFSLFLPLCISLHTYTRKAHRDKQRSTLRRQFRLHRAEGSRFCRKLVRAEPRLPVVVAILFLSYFPFVLLFLSAFVFGFFFFVKCDTSCAGSSKDETLLRPFSSLPQLLHRPLSNPLYFSFLYPSN